MNSVSLKSDALKRACFDLCKIENKRYECFENVEVHIPKSVDGSIKEMIFSLEKKVSHKRLLIKAASIILAVLIISGAALTINVEAREKLSRLIRKMTGTKIEYDTGIENTNQETATVIKSIAVKWVPDGFELMTSQVNNKTIWYYYTKDKDMIYIQCSIITDNTYVGFFNADGSALTTELGEYKGLDYEFVYADKPSDNNNLIIIDNNNNYYVAINSILDKDTLFKIFDNIEIEC